MKKLKKLVSMLMFSVFVAAPVLTFVSPQAALAKSPADCEISILGIAPWYRGLSKVDAQGMCGIASPGETLASGKTLDLTGFIWRIGLNVLDIALGAVGYIAFFFVLYGGFLYLTGGDKPGQVEKARQTILNAVIGLVIALGATAVINLIFGIVG